MGELRVGECGFWLVDALGLLEEAFTSFPWPNFALTPSGLPPVLREVASDVGGKLGKSCVSGGGKSMMKWEYEAINRPEHEEKASTALAGRGRRRWLFI